MKKLFASTLAIAAMATALLPAVAAPATTPATAKTKTSAAPVKCPSCGMPMPATKSAAMSVPIYLAKSKRTVYCCAGCKSGKAAAAYWKAHKKAMSVPM